MKTVEIVTSKIGTYCIPVARLQFLSCRVVQETVQLVPRFKKSVSKL